MDYVLLKMLKTFCDNNLFKTIALKSLKEFVNQDTTKTFVNNNSNENDANNSNIHWFINEESYVELGEKVLKMVGLLKSEECYSANNYNHIIIHARFSNQIIVTVPGSTDASLEQVHEKKIKVLQDRLTNTFNTHIHNLSMN